MPEIMSVSVILSFWLFLCVWASPGYAHVANEGLALDDWHWRPDVLLVVVFFGVTYARGWLRLRHKALQLAPWWQFSLYLLALMGLVLALLSPIDTLASTRLSMHMVQHLLLLMIAPLFFLLANPMAVFLWGLPDLARRRVGVLLARRSPFRRGLRTLTWLPVAWFVYVIDLWAWHHPYPYQQALGNPWVHDLQHLLFFATSLLFWWPVANPAPRLHGTVAYGYRIVYLIVATMQNTVLGAFLAFPEKILYPFYGSFPGLRSLSPIEDQALGGGIMWVSGHMYLIPILVLVARMLTREEEEARKGISKGVTTKASV